MFAAKDEVAAADFDKECFGFAKGNATMLDTAFACHQSNHGFERSHGADRDLQPRLAVTVLHLAKVNTNTQVGPGGMKHGS